MSCDDLFDLDHLNEKDTRYDELFLSVLQSEGKIEPFIDSVFKFLYRRTDFFLIQEQADQPYGFPQGVAKQIILKQFQKYDNLSKEKLKKKLFESNEEIARKSHKEQAKKESTKVNTNSTPSVPQSTLSASTKPNGSDLDSSLSLKKKQEVFQSNSASYNGAIRENYSWSQTIKDIDVRVKISSSIKSSKDVRVKIEKTSLSVATRDQTSQQWSSIIDDNLAFKIKPDECTWSLFPGDHIHIYLEKTEERWWENLMEKEEKLDLKNMNPEKPMEDLEPEAQAKLKQLMYDEQQKRLGLPTSEQQKMNDLLKKSWDAEGSPFKGTPFDPSIIKNPNENDFNFN